MASYRSHNETFNQAVKLEAVKAATWRSDMSYHGNEAATSRATDVSAVWQRRLSQHTVGGQTKKPNRTRKRLRSREEAKASVVILNQSFSTERVIRGRPDSLIGEGWI
jgi:hypothetical protein